MSYNNYKKTHNADSEVSFICHATQLNTLIKKCEKFKKKYKTEQIINDKLNQENEKLRNMIQKKIVSIDQIKDSLETLCIKFDAKEQQYKDKLEKLKRSNENLKKKNEELLKEAAIKSNHSVFDSLSNANSNNYSNLNDTVELEEEITTKELKIKPPKTFKESISNKELLDSYKKLYKLYNEPLATRQKTNKPKSESNGSERQNREEFYEKITEVFNSDFLINRETFKKSANNIIRLFETELNNEMPYSERILSNLFLISLKV